MDGIQREANRIVHAKCQLEIDGLNVAIKKLQAESERLLEDCECYKAMKDGVSQRIRILEMERDEARKAAAIIWDGGISTTEALDRWPWLDK